MASVPETAVAVKSGALGAGLAAINTATTGKDDAMLLMGAKCRGLLRGYAARWDDTAWRVLAVEQMVTAGLWNPSTERKSRSFDLAGVLDLIVEQDNQPILVDHKTTSSEIEDPAAPYWKQLVVEAQASHYMLLEWLNGRKVDGAVWDVVRKPGISPRAITKKEMEAVTFSGVYFGLLVSDLDREFLCHEQKETLAMYEARLARDCIVDRPTRYFQRRPVPRLDSEIHEHAQDVWEHSQEILHARATGRWQRNSGACMLYNSPCRFLGICSGHDTPGSDNWRRKAQVHNELPLPEGDGRNVLTNSRIRCFQTCRQKHYLDYELGIERQDDEEREALIFGSLWHAGQAAYFNAMRGEQ